MEPNDKDLKQQLSRGPLIKHGFDARLVARIEEAIERPVGRRHPFLRFGWHGAGLAAMAVLLLFVGLWHWSFGSGGPAGSMDLQRAGQTAGTEAPLFADADAELHSALLLGLRADPKSEDGNVVSSYRTLFIAPTDGQFELAAQGEGIVMPYGQNFWKIEAVSTDAGSQALAQKLIAYPVTGKDAAKTDLGALRESSAAPLAERLLFVGNKYVSVEQNPSDAPNRVYRWVKDMDQLAAGAQRTAFEPESEPHVSLEEAMKTAEATETPVAEKDAAAPVAHTEQWSIIRRTGSWVAAAADTAGQPYAPLANKTLTELSTPLPESINKFDTLYPTWSQILQIEPGAKDAFSSPNEDMLVIVLDGELVVYPYHLLGGEQDPLRIPLQSNESLIMAQWAKEDKYLDSWKKQLATVLVDDSTVRSVK
ncbi:hypothetical protein SAMN05216312_104224 [Cohnella sp. OV330]|uniref:hypothetical protein n=1 Tax=Cohnella sp. OV330 TaxID=1855288 RepID=UPI0008E4B37B|nr:hypothetical protein [Cohnella sp. OV330]SFB17539.1 hypothetical protein SAMN05216312_104224 [Cohnella sp. OV330]